MKLTAHVNETKPMHWFAVLILIIITWFAYCYVMPTLLPQVSTVYTDPTFLNFWCFLWISRFVPRLMFRSLRIPK